MNRPHLLFRGVWEVTVSGGRVPGVPRVVLGQVASVEKNKGELCEVQLLLPFWRIQRLSDGPVDGGITTNWSREYRYTL